MKARGFAATPTPYAFRFAAMPGIRALLMVLFVATLTMGAEVDYNRDIKPLLREKCAACHGALKQEAGLRLDAAVLIHQGGDSGAVLNSDNPDESLLLERIVTSDTSDQMPPTGEGERLNPEQLQLLKAWISGGAAIPTHEPIPADPKDHWAYQRPVRRSVPLAGGIDRLHNPIDAFLESKRRPANVVPTRSADKRTLIRRLYFDLIGLPPTRRQMDAFVGDPSQDAYDRLVDALLSSPQYSERWGRHWMDIWRYSDWNGYKDQLRGSQRHIWRWRDWILESLNEDKGYDQLILEMLAGDELAPEDLNVLRATGFLARNYHNSNRNIWLDATVEHTSKAFLGMTINCARCHDHKFDPIAQREYYAMRAVFEPHNVRTERIAGQRDVKDDGVPRVFDATPDAKTHLFIRGNEKHFDESSTMSAGIPAVFQETLDIIPVSLPPIAMFPALWPHIETEDLRDAEQQVAAAEKRLAKNQTNENALPGASELAQLELDSAKAGLRALQARWAADKAKYSPDEHSTDDSNKAIELAERAAKRERSAAVTQARYQLADAQSLLLAAKSKNESDAAKKETALKNARQNVEKAREQLTAAKVEADKKDHQYTSVGRAYPRFSTGRRLALAKWIANPNNPLTARVAINHIWLRHFGQPLVANTFDFGLRSPRPVHADLLDWLAVELMEHQWSMKHVHRMLVTSSAYQLRSSAVPELTDKNSKVDPDNHLYWRANQRRLTAEAIRDSVLHVAESLDLQQGGTDIDFNRGETVPRRSLYFRHAYEKQMTMLVLFDVAGPNECYRRSESIIPQQALTLANSSLALSESRKLARTLWNEATQSADAELHFVQLAFLQILARQPTEQEVHFCRSFLKQQSELLASPNALTEFGGKSKPNVPAAKNPKLRAKENMVHALMNHNDFVTVR